MSQDDASYYRQRAVTQRAMAFASERENVREIHEELARKHEALAQTAKLRAEFGAAMRQAKARAASSRMKLHTAKRSPSYRVMSPKRCTDCGKVIAPHGASAEGLHHLFLRDETLHAPPADGAHNGSEVHSRVAEK